MSNLPFIALGNDELAMCPRVSLPATIACPRCDATHPLEADERVLPDGTREPSPLLFYACGPSTYLAAIDGALLFGLTLAAEESADGA